MFPQLSALLILICFWLLRQNQLQHIPETSFFLKIHKAVSPVEVPSHTLVYSRSQAKTIFLFENFTKTFNKTYKRGSREYRKRFDNFKASLKRQKANGRTLVGLFHLPPTSSPHAAVFGITKFADLTPAEFRRKFLTLNLTLSGEPKRHRTAKRRRVRPNILRKYLAKNGLPLKLDWRSKGVVTLIKDQGPCGACYAVSTVEVIESARSLKIGRLSEDLSVQQVLDCSGNMQCDGGNPEQVLRWLTERSIFRQERRLAFEKDYPTKFVDQKCSYSRSRKGIVSLKDYSCEEANNEFDILAKVAQGPVTAAVDSSSWQDYAGGVIKHHCDNDVNHAVAIVGYDVTGPIPFYIVRNSWGKDYGDKGYVYIRIGRDLCGIRTQICSVDM